MKYSIECWLTRPGPDILLLRVPARQGEHNAFWQPVTGGIETGETPAQAALREIVEEAGLELTEGDLTEIASGITVVISPGNVISKTIYIAQTYGDVVRINPGEHEEYQWFSAPEVFGALYWNSNKDTWKLISQKLEINFSYRCT